MDSGKTLSFHPKEVSFKHGYASTVYKAQGASIDEVFVFHGGFSTTRNSYVKMSRHVKNIRFYSNAETTKNLTQLTKQLLRPDDRSASIAYRTTQECHPPTHPPRGLRERCQKWLSQKKVQFSDLMHNNAPYYQLDEKAHPEVTVKKTSTPLSPLVTLKTEGSKADIIPLFPEKQQNANPTSISQSDSRGSSVQTTSKTNHRLHCQEDLQRLRQELKWGVERIARQLLGEPNTTLSNKAQLRFGNKGSLTVNISGEKAGLWHDFSTSEGGDLLKLIMQQQNIGFKQAVKEARSLLGQSSIETVFEAQRLNTMVKEHHAGNKVKRIQHLFQQSLPSNPVLQNYLSKGRGIEGELPADIRFLTSFKHSETQTKLPALMAFARNAQGDIQGGQAIYLDAELACKADIHPNKRSLGVIKGNFVEIQPASMGVSLLAEGIETALSLKEAHIPGRILCSLGVGNFKNYTPKANETVIICADNDGNASQTEKTVAKAVTTLQKQCDSVFVIQPKEIGDFNDVLRHQGKEAVQQLILPELSNHITPEWLSLWQQQKEQGWIKEDLLCSQDIAIVNQHIASRHTVLDQFYREHTKEIAEIQQWSSPEQVEQLKKELRHLSHSRENKLKQTHLHCFEQFVKKEISQFDQEKAQPQSLDTVVKTFQKEKEFCNSIYEHYFPQVEALRNKGMEDIPKRRAMYRNHPTVIEDFQRDVLFSSKHTQDKQDRLDRQYILQKISHQPLASVQRELFAFCQKKVMDQLNHDLEQIKQNGIRSQHKHSYHNEQQLLKSAYTDNMQQPYLKGTEMENRLLQLQEADKTAEQNRSPCCEHTLYSFFLSFVLFSVNVL